MADPFTIGGAVLGAGISAYGASRGNSAVKDAMASTVNAAAVQQQQLALRTALEKRRSVNEAERVVGALRVAGGESGGVAGSYAALIRQADLDASLNQAIIGQNYTNETQRLGSATAAELAGLRRQYRSPILAGVTGGFQGARIGQQAGELFPAAPPEPPPIYVPASEMSPYIPNGVLG